MNKIIRFKKISKKKFYLILARNFDYINKIIINNFIKKNKFKNNISIFKDKKD